MSTQEASQPTPGQWRTGGAQAGQVWSQQSGHTVAICVTTEMVLDAERDANARLIAKAPDLLTALRSLRGLLADDDVLVIENPMTFKAIDELLDRM